MGEDGVRGQRSVDSVFAEYSPEARELLRTSAIRLAISVRDIHNIARVQAGRSATPVVTMGAFASDQYTKFVRTFRQRSVHLVRQADLWRVHVAHPEVNVCAASRLYI
jgi:hypothetical protein